MNAPLVVPADMPAYGRDYLTQLDAAVTKAVATACISSESYRIVAASYRNSGDEFKARDADRMADRIELDPRLYVAGAMHTHTPDGTAKFYLHRYIELIEEQAKCAVDMNVTLHGRLVASQTARRAQT